MDDTAADILTVALATEQVEGIISSLSSTYTTLGGHEKHDVFSRLGGLCHYYIVLIVSSGSTHQAETSFVQPNLRRSRDKGSRKNAVAA